MAKKNIFSRIFGRIGNYFSGVIYQARKVRWPSRNELIKNSVIVLGFATFFAVFLNLCNLVIIWMFRALGLNL